MTDTEKQMSLDYRRRINHLSNALGELARAVTLLGQRMPDEGDEGIAEKVQDFVSIAKDAINEACWEL